MLLNSKYNLLKPFKVKKLVRLGRNYDGGYLVCFETLKKCENLIIEIHSINQLKIDGLINNFKKISYLKLEEIKHSVYYFKRIKQ